MLYKSSLASVMPSTDFSVFLFENDFLALFPELFLVITSIILLVSGVWVSTSVYYGKPILVTQSSWLAVYSLFLCYVLMYHSDLNNGYMFYNCLVMDQCTLFLKGLLCVAAIMCILISIEYNKKECINPFELPVLLLISTCSMLFMIQSADLISIYLSIELQSLCFYVMAALKSNSAFSSEAGLKYFLLGAFSSGILLIGCSLVYGFTGCTELASLSKLLSCGAQETILHTHGYANLESIRGCELGMVFICVAFLFKITAVPFHVWAPDVYEGAPTTVTAFFSLAPKVALLGIMIKLFGISGLDLAPAWQKMLIFSSLLSMVLGSFAAMSQNKIKRMLAFSSIGHVGYMLVALSLDSLLGIQALCTYLVTYVFMTASLFSIFLLHCGRYDVSSSASLAKVARIKYITDLTQLGINNPALAACLTVTMFSMAGIPPLAGFYAKASVFLAALSSSQYLLAVVGVLTSVVSCYYYIRLVKIMYFENQTHFICFDRPQKASTLIMSSCFFFLIALMIYPSPLYIAAHMCSLNLF